MKLGDLPPGPPLGAFETPLEALLLQILERRGALTLHRRVDARGVPIVAVVCDAWAGEVSIDLDDVRRRRDEHAGARMLAGLIRSAHWRVVG